MINKIKSIVFVSATLLALASAGCKKGTFDVNDVNPNTPSSVDPKYILAAALTNSATLVSGNPGGGAITGNDLIECIIGYWAVSGDYSPNFNTSSMTLTPDYGSSIWNNTYPVIQNLKNIDAYYGTSATGNNYLAISKIIKSLLFSRLVDCYNNIPYSQANAGATNSFPVYDDAQTVYKSCINQLDSAVLLINSAATTADNPATYDVMYGGTMAKWAKFATTLKLKMLMKFTFVSGGPAYIASKMTGLTTASFIGANSDATVQPGYSNNTNANLNPMWYDIGFTTTAGTGVNTSYFRACSYAVNFYKNTADTFRLQLFYTPIAGTTTVNGRAFGSNSGTEHNATVSAIGGDSLGLAQTSGYLKSPGQGSVMLSSAESFFLQAEAVQRGYLTGATAASLYQSGVAESFRVLGVAGYAAAAATYVSQSGDNVNIVTSSNPLKTIILQKWAASNIYDPLEAWSDWRRTGYPSDLPIPIYPGTTITHMPYRLLYPTSEYTFNSINVNAQGTITQNNKIFWMP